MAEGLSEWLENACKGITLVDIRPVLWAPMSHGLSWDLNNLRICKSEAAEATWDTEQVYHLLRNLPLLDQQGAEEWM